MNRHSKIHHRRVDAEIRRTAQAFEEQAKAERDVAVAKVKAQRAAQIPVDPSELVGARYVKDIYGWHEVVRVNKTTVTVKTGYSWTDRIPVGRIVAVRKNEEITTDA